MKAIRVKTPEQVRLVREYYGKFVESDHDRPIDHSNGSPIYVTENGQWGNVEGGLSHELVSFEDWFNSWANDFRAGDWVMFIGDPKVAGSLNDDCYKIGTLYKAKRIYNDFGDRLETELDSSGSTKNGWMTRMFRKPTQVELEKAPRVGADRKIVGYKLLIPVPGHEAGAILKKNLECWLLGPLTGPFRYDFMSNEVTDTKFFEPIFEEEKKIIKVAYADGILDVEIMNGKARVEGHSLSKDQLEFIINPRTSVGAYDIRVETFSVGCKKDITRASVEQIIKAL